MLYRQLGASRTDAGSCFALGTASFGVSDVGAKSGAVDVAAAQRQVDLALEAGVNFIDTADAYGSGASETVLSQVLQGRRDQVVLATKARFPTGTGPTMPARLATTWCRLVRPACGGYGPSTSTSTSSMSGTVKRRWRKRFLPLTSWLAAGRSAMSAVRILPDGR